MYDYYQPIPLLDTMVCTGCCATLDHIVTYLFKQVMMKGKQNVFFVRYRDHPMLDTSATYANQAFL